MKTCRGVEILIHAFLELGTRWRGVDLFTPRALYPRRNSWESNPGHPGYTYSPSLRRNGKKGIRV
jgi:hypothetical protein